MQKVIHKSFLWGVWDSVYWFGFFSFLTTSAPSGFSFTHTWSNNAIQLQFKFASRFQRCGHQRGHQRGLPSLPAFALLFNTRSWPGHIIASCSTTAGHQREHQAADWSVVRNHFQPLSSTQILPYSSQESCTTHKHITHTQPFFPPSVTHTHTVWIVGQCLMWWQCVRCAVAVEAAVSL